MLEKEPLTLRSMLETVHTPTDPLLGDFGTIFQIKMFTAAILGRPNYCENVTIGTPSLFSVTRQYNGKVRHPIFDILFLGEAHSQMAIFKPYLSHGDTEALEIPHNNFLLTLKPGDLKRKHAETKYSSSCGYLKAIYFHIPFLAQCYQIQLTGNDIFIRAETSIKLTTPELRIDFSPADRLLDSAGPLQELSTLEPEEIIPYINGTFHFFTQPTVDQCLPQPQKRTWL